MCGVRYRQVRVLGFQEVIVTHLHLSAYSFIRIGLSGTRQNVFGLKLVSDGYVSFNGGSKR